jgi:hypothetical protein
MYRVALLAFITFAFCSTASAQRHRALPLPIVPDALGVNIHFTDPESGEMEMLAAGGFRWVRMDLAGAAPSASAVIQFRRLRPVDGGAG